MTNNIIELGKATIKAAENGDCTWDDLNLAFDQALDEIAELEQGRDALLAHIDDLYLRIEALENQLDRTRMESIGMAYNLAGPGR
jgi:hypothetical protein